MHVEDPAAWVAAEGEASAGALTIPYRVLVVLVRRGGAWRIHCFNGGEPRAA